MAKDILIKLSVRMGWLLGIAAIFAMSAGGATPKETFAPLRLGEITPEGWLRAQLERDLKTGFHGNFDILLQHRRTGEFILQEEHNDYVTREKNRDSRRAPDGRTIPAAPQAWWNAEMIGDWFDSLIRGAFLVGDANARQKGERFIEALLKSQDEDGYIGIYPKGYRFHFASADGELWTQRCAFLPMLAYYEFTGRNDVLEAVERAVTHTISQYGPGVNYFDNPKQPNSGVSHGLLFVDVLEWLHRLTGKEIYAKAAVDLYDNYSASRVVANKDAQLGRLLKIDAPLGGHGPDIMGFLRIPLWSFYVTGKPEYRQAWDNSIIKLDRHLGVGGSPLSGHKEEIIREGQTPDMPYEFCSTFYLLHSLAWAIQKGGEPRYGDMFEKTLFNAAQGARFSDGKALTYYSADERLWVRQNPPEGTGNNRYIYTAAYYPSCCHNSGARSYPYAISSMWMRSTGPDGDGLVATLYGPSKVSTKISGVPVTVIEKTDYPFCFEIEFTINPEREVFFPVRLRIPEWASGHKLAARGASVSRDPRGFLVVEKKWRAGDKVRLTLNAAIHGREAVNGTVALAYGPLVYSLPIPEKAEIVQSFPQAEAVGLKGFHGYQYDPADLNSAKRQLNIKTKKAPFGFKLVKDKTADSRFPWDRSPLQLQGEMIGTDGKQEKVTLLPMGCTILRRTCF
jgi:uncharacterized protein